MTDKIDSRISATLAAGDGFIRKHFAKELGEIVPDADLDELAGAARAATEAAQAALRSHDAIMKNPMQTDLAKQREARKIAWAHFEKASKKIDAARDRVMRDIKKVEQATSAPPAPVNVPQAMLESEIRARLADMPAKERDKAISAAIETGDDLTIGAALHGPVLLTGMGEAEREARRHAWRTRRFPQETDRIRRLKAAVADLDRQASLLLPFIDGLTDQKAIEAAERAEKAALAAVA